MEMLNIVNVAAVRRAKNRNCTTFCILQTTANGMVTAVVAVEATKSNYYKIVYDNHKLNWTGSFPFAMHSQAYNTNNGRRYNSNNVTANDCDGNNNNNNE